MSITVLLVDDQPLLRTGFRLILGAERDMTVVGEAADGAEAVQGVRDLAPDVVLMDVRMPVMDGVTATRQIVESGSAAKVLILTTFDLDDYAFDGLRAGASGFLLKDVPAPELVGAIRAVAAGDAVVSPRITRQLIDTHLRRGTNGTGSPHEALLARLTPREHEVLLHVAAARSNAEISADLFLAETTVKTHVTRILSKLELRDRVQAVVLAYQNGLVQP